LVLDIVIGEGENSLPPRLPKMRKGNLPPCFILPR